MKKIITKSEKETFELGKNFAKKLKGGEVIGLVGNLGAGKTVFTKGLGKGLKIKEVISSPTFVLMKIYKTKNKNIKSLIHIDAYRLQSEKDLEIIGIAEYLNKKDNVIIIEWPEKIKKILPKKTRYIDFSYLEEDASKRAVSL
jgi:tRNA threonylcarbamoyladenosine biosynthesis protein TsaE